MQRAQEQQADLADLIQHIKAILTQDDNASAYFASELDWLNHREKLWQSDAFRVGLIGITSSGKSTLVNALLGAELLPHAVRPSSNSLVVCEWGKRLECIVHFKEPGRKPVAILGSAIAKRLKEYGDEATNPGNVKGVAEIRLRSPNFRLGQGVTLVDTPGLDAFGHDEHERLTLEVLLPTVDVVVFVTTCKANSDEKMREYVCLAHDHGKPIVVVQNMMDSVLEKPGAHGEILKSRDEVLAEHRSRVQSVLKKAGVESVLISQVSAIWALRQPDKASGLPEFIAGVQGRFDELAPAVAQGRGAQLNEWLREFVDRELQPGDPAAIYRRQKAEARRLANLTDEFDARYTQMKEEARREPAAIAREGDPLLEQTDGLTSTSIDDASALQANVERWLKRSAASLSTLNKRVLGQIAADHEKLNLRADDLDLSTQLARSIGNLGFTTTHRHRRVRVEQPGLFGSFKRGVDIFGQDWGVDERIETWTEIEDINAFRKSVQGAVKKQRATVESFADAIVERIEDARKQFRKELRARARGLEAKMSAQEGLVGRNAIARELEALLARPGKRKQAASDPASRRTAFAAAPVAEQSVHEIEVGSAALALTRLATLIAQHRFVDMRNEVLFDQAFKRVRDERRVLIVGFDSDSLVGFVNRFWFDMVEAEAGRKITFSKCRIDEGCMDEIAVAVLGDAASVGTWNAVSTFLSSPCVVFLVLDVQQVGASESALERAEIPYDPSMHPIVAVVQSIRELENSGAVCEALFELKALAKRHKLKLAGVLVNDEKVYYSALANRLVATRAPFATVAEENRFIASLPEENRADAGKIVRAWRATTTA
ncbi:dynamin family protein [Paraburkholderia sp. FT54]|uniref:dynamin family protein n=1 Tax=Paraburkholderia sp. FT54 TaxID=3074437 RepID=UPI00287762CE|nr:dynamin family protein [Paraburkholderia sp. FT54]WNC92151.1 dynamin family protein [Paraburkholderia sp. FT54]